MDVEAVTAGQAVSLLLLVDAGTTRGHRPATRPVPGRLTPSLDLVIGTVAVRGSLVLDGNDQLIARRQFQGIRRVASVLDGLSAAAITVPLATDELVALAGKQDAKLVAEIVFKIY